MAVDASKLRGEIIDEAEPENKDVEGLLNGFIQSIRQELIGKKPEGAPHEQ